LGPRFGVFLQSLEDLDGERPAVWLVGRSCWTSAAMARSRTSGPAARRASATASRSTSVVVIGIRVGVGERRNEDLARARACARIRIRVRRPDDPRQGTRGGQADMPVLVSEQRDEAVDGGRGVGAKDRQGVGRRDLERAVVIAQVDDQRRDDGFAQDIILVGERGQLVPGTERPGGGEADRLVRVAQCAPPR